MSGRGDPPGDTSDGEDFHSADEEEHDAGELFEDTSESLASPCDKSGGVTVIEPDLTDDDDDHSANHDRSAASDPDLLHKLAEDDRKKEEEEEEEDFIDEEYLKDLELNLTEEERQTRKEEGLKHKEDGNKEFKNGCFEEAREAYTAGLRVCPLSCPKERAVLYANRAAAKAKLELKKEAIKDCTCAIEQDDTYVKAILRRATLQEETDSLDEALKDFQRVLELNPGTVEAQAAVRRLPPLIEQRNEKLKEEMMGKLKELGNMVLRPFGLSTNNFQLQQDPNTGGYNIQFKQ